MNIQIQLIPLNQCSLKKNKKRKKKKKKEKAISFFKLENYQLLIISFGKNYYLKELSQINILWTVL